MINNLHKKLFTDNTPFSYAAITALVIGVGDLIATGSDIYWLIGDMSLKIHPHHYPVMIGLVIAFLVMAISFTYLYISIDKFLKRRNERVRKADEKRRARKAKARRDRAIEAHCRQFYQDFNQWRVY